MSPTELIVLLRDSDVRLSLKDNGKLGVNAPKGVLTPTLLGELREHKPILLRLLATNPEVFNFESTGNRSVYSKNSETFDSESTGNRSVYSKNSGFGQGSGNCQNIQNGFGENQNAKQEPQPDRLGETAERLRSRSGLPPRPATSTEPGNVAPTARRPAPARGVSIPWPGAAADFVLLLGPDDLPATPFRLSPGVVVYDAGRFLRWLRRDIALGMDSPRAVWGCLQSDVLRLRELLIDPDGARGPYPATSKQQQALGWLLSAHPGRKAGPSDGPECLRVLSRLQAKYPETVGGDDGFVAFLKERWDAETRDCGG